MVRAGLSPQRAAEVVRVARRRGELTDASAALDAGELSLDQVAVVARIPAAYQAGVTKLARNMTVPQLRRVAARHAFPKQDPSAAGAADGTSTGSGNQTREERSPAFAPDPRSEGERRACARPELSMSYDADGRFQLRYSAPATVGALVEQAIREAKDALFTRGGADLPNGGTGAPTYADALEEIAHRSLASVGSSSRRCRYRVYLHLSTDGAWVGGGPAIPLRLLGRFISDGTVQPVWETDGRPVSVGRAMRILPERTRRLIEDRDRGCRPTRPDGLIATNRYGISIRPPTPVETSPASGGDPPVPPGTYQPPSGECFRWRDLEVPPDTDLPVSARHRVTSPHTAHIVDDPLDAMVYDSYRRHPSAGTET